MLSKRLREPQLEAIQNTVEAIGRGHYLGLWCLPTGVGKTFAAVELMRLLGMPTLFCVHRDPLVRQTQNTLAEWWPQARVGVVKAERNEWDRDVVIASIQSLNEKRLSQIPPDRFGLVVVDEAHHIASPSWSRAVTHFDSGFRLGLSATPDRLDGKGLAEFFGPQPLYSYSLLRAIRDGYLVDVRQYAVKTGDSLDGVESQAGDFVNAQLAEVIDTDERNQTIVEAWRKHASDRLTICFCINIDHAKRLAAQFNADGVEAVAITGEMEVEERAILLEGFAEGQFKVLTSVQIFTEGFDCPPTSCVIMARPTRSRAFYTQCVGRALRLWPGKRDALVLDITDNCERHKLVTAMSLLGAKQSDGQGESIVGVLEREEREEQERQDHIRDWITGPLVWRVQSVCPWPGLPTLNGYMPKALWQDQPASDKQVEMLRRFGLGVQRELTKGEASWLIDQALAYEEAFPTPASSKQEFFLRLNGRWNEGMTKKEASRIIGEMKQGERQVQTA